MSKEEGAGKEHLVDDIEKVISDLDSQKEKLRGLLHSLKTSQEPEQPGPVPEPEGRGTIHKLISQEKEDSGKRIRNYAASLEELKKQLQELKEASKEDEDNDNDQKQEDNNTEVASAALDEPIIENSSAVQRQQHRRIISDNLRPKAQHSLRYSSEARTQSLYVTSTDRVRPVVRIRKAAPEVPAKANQKKEAVKRPRLEKYETRPQTCDACCIV